MKHQWKGFVAGITTALIICSITVTSLAASGTISFSGVNLKVNGQEIAESGDTYLLDNGCAIPYSLVYTDEKGGGTTYLSVRKISELLGLDIGWDSASKSVILNSGNPTSEKYTYTDENGKYAFGAFNGKPTGTVEVTLDSGVTYKGEFDDTQITGKGTMTYPNIGSYTGEFLNGEKSGHGIFTWSDGSRYDGEWLYDKMSGNGSYYYNSGSIHKLVGTFANNAPHGTIKYYDASGNSFTTTWENGKCVNIAQ